MRILIATGIYPPALGGPAQYAKNLKNAFEIAGHKVSVATFSVENYLPTGVRHVYFFAKVLCKIIMMDYVVVLDTFSVGLPTVAACKILRKKVVVRTGGDFLWEGYVERTGELVLLKNFYQTTQERWTRKDRTIFSLTRWTLKNASWVAFSTEWQRGIFTKAYDLDVAKSSVIENYYGERDAKVFEKTITSPRTFVGGTRPLRWKNIPRLTSAFCRAQKRVPNIVLDVGNAPYDVFMQKMSKAYAIVLVSLGDISPNMVLDALRLGIPAIMTRESGLYDKLKDVVMTVDPENEQDIEAAIVKLSDPVEYEKQRTKIKEFTFTHTWDEIAKEFVGLYDMVH